MDKSNEITFYSAISSVILKADNNKEISLSRFTNFPKRFEYSWQLFELLAVQNVGPESLASLASCLIRHCQDGNT